MTIQTEGVCIRVERHVQKTLPSGTLELTCLTTVHTALSEFSQATNLRQRAKIVLQNDFS